MNKTLSVSQILYYTEKPSKWLGYVSKIDPKQFEVYYAVWSVVDKIITNYNINWLWDTSIIDKLMSEEIWENFVLPDDYIKAKNEIIFALDNYISSSPKRDEMPQAKLEAEIDWYKVTGYVDWLWIDYKVVSSFAKEDDKPFNSTINTYTKYRYWALIYSWLLLQNWIKVDKYFYKEILKKDCSIPENTTLTKEKLLEIIGNYQEEDKDLKKSDLIIKYRPKKDSINVIEFKVNDEFIKEAEKLVKDNIQLIEWTLAKLQLWLWH